MEQNTEVFAERSAGVTTDFQVITVPHVEPPKENPPPNAQKSEKYRTFNTIITKPQLKAVPMAAAQAKRARKTVDRTGLVRWVHVFISVAPMHGRRTSGSARRSRGFCFRDFGREISSLVTGGTQGVLQPRAE